MSPNLKTNSIVSFIGVQSPFAPSIRDLRLRMSICGNLLNVSLLMKKVALYGKMQIEKIPIFYA